MRGLPAIIILICLGLSTPLRIWAQEEIPRDQLEQSVTGKLVETDIMQKKVLRYYEEKYGYNSVETLRFIEALAWMSMELQDYRQAEDYYLRAIEIREEKLPESIENTKNLGVAYFRLADSYLYREYYLEAESYFGKSLKHTTDLAQQGDILSRMGIVNEGLKEYEKSIEQYLSAIKRYETAKNRKPKYRQPINRRLHLAYGALVQLYKIIKDEGMAKKYTDLKLTVERLMRE